MFQSLSGFFRPCNLDTDFLFCLYILFQSLSGFFRPCNRPLGLRLVGEDRVSIPVGFFQALQLRTRIEIRNLVYRVSIPVGFFQALQLALRRRCLRPLALFQSLSGFFRPCNTMKIEIDGKSRDGFNPCRVFSGLATSTFRGRVPLPGPRFNPCRVFSGLATSSLVVAVVSCHVFQSLSGFFRPCNGAHWPPSISFSRWVSIPVGFFQALQPRPLSQCRISHLRFNPCRVFSGLATTCQKN